MPGRPRRRPGCRWGRRRPDARQAPAADPVGHPAGARHPHLHRLRRRRRHRAAHDRSRKGPNTIRRAVEQNEAENAMVLTTIGAPPAPLPDTQITSSYTVFSDAIESEADAWDGYERAVQRAREDDRDGARSPTTPTGAPPRPSSPSRRPCSWGSSAPFEMSSPEPRLEPTAPHHLPPLAGRFTLIPAALGWRCGVQSWGAR